MPVIEKNRLKVESVMKYYNKPLDERVTVLYLKDFPPERLKNDEAYVSIHVDEMLTDILQWARYGPALPTPSPPHCP